MVKLQKFSRAVGVLTSTLALAGAAHAAGVNAGTSVENTFTLTYEIENNAQPTITNDTDTAISGANIQGTETLFTVDRLIDLTVETLGSELTVAPNSSDNRHIFRLTNLGNDNQAYDLVTALPGGNDYVPANISIEYFIDLNSNDAFDSGTETLVTYTLGTATADIAKDQRVIMYVESDVPVTAADTESAEIILTADTLNPVTSVEAGFAGTAGVAVAGDSDGNNLVSVAENVLADGAGSTDSANQGDFSATASQTVQAPNLAASKIIVILEDDPADDAACTALTAAASGDQYSIPSACIQYVIDIENTGTGTASALVIFDRLPAEVTFLQAILTTSSGTGFADDPDVAGTGPTVTAPGSSQDCDGSSNCGIQLDDAILGPSQDGQIRIWATVD